MSIEGRRNGKTPAPVRPKPQNQGVPHTSADAQTRSDGAGIRMQVGSGVTNQISWYDGDTLVGFLVVSASPYVLLISGVGAAVNIAVPLSVNTLTMGGGLKATQGGKTLANGANNDVNLGTPQYVSNLITGPTGAFNITGIANGVDGSIVFLTNGTNQVMTIRDNNAGSTAGNRILTGTGGDVAVNHAILMYDITNAVWRLY